MYMPVLKTIPSTISSFVLVFFKPKRPDKLKTIPAGMTISSRVLAMLCSSTFATGFVSPWGFSGRTWYWFYQDTTKIISRKRFYIIMLCIYIVSFDFKTRYKYFLPWQHLPEVGEYLLSLHYQKKPEAKEHREFQARKSGNKTGQPDGSGLWRGRALSRVATVSINIGLYIV